MSITDGRPDGYTTLTPFLVCSPARDAIAFYSEVFGATAASVMDGPDGTVLHAELRLPLGRLQLSDPMEGYGLVAPEAGAQAVTGSTCVYVPDVDATFAAARRSTAPPCARSRRPSSPATGSPRLSTRSATAGRS